MIANGNALILPQINLLPAYAPIIDQRRHAQEQVSEPHIMNSHHYAMIWNEFLQNGIKAAFHLNEVLGFKKTSCYKVIENSGIYV